VEPAVAGSAFALISRPIGKDVIMPRYSWRSIAAGLALLLPLGMAEAAELKFEHVMNIGSDGTGEGQFKYIEDIAFSKDGHLLVTDAALAWVQVAC
jgi:hypothetical protein